MIKRERMITIPKPCHEDWNAMTPKERGRLCDKCCKVVVDFTSQTTEQIAGFLKDQLNAGKKVCGRFQAEQVTAPVVVQPRFPRKRIFLAALYFVFGSLLFTSCDNGNTEVMGKLVANVDTPQVKHLMGDTTIAVDTTKPGTAVVPDTKHKTKPVCRIQPPVQDTIEPMIMGEVELRIPDSTDVD